ncbi:MAG TPA: isochorismatase family cysteine hydrolase [Pyrinomonadaceae bacterium]|nr:isochorismatase family cysteine hydrolase [Pyrinomonadaceae bacterium]
MEQSQTNNLHGNAPDNSEIAIVLIDVINDLEFDEGDQLLETALPAARNIARLKQRAREAKVPIIYVNDNFGRWRSDFKMIVDRCLHSDVRGRPIAELLVPDEDDYFVLKPKHSGFFSTTLDLLLEYLGVRTLIVAGFAGNNCVLFTANDAYMRDYKLIIPADCTASNTPADNETALQQMSQVLKADIRPSIEIDFVAYDRQHAKANKVASQR